MEFMTYEEAQNLLNEKLETDYPEDSVELGDRWELIAEIFFKAGYEKAKQE